MKRSYNTRKTKTKITTPSDKATVKVQPKVSAKVKKTRKRANSQKNEMPLPSPVHSSRIEEDEETSTDDGSASEPKERKKSTKFETKSMKSEDTEKPEAKKSIKGKKKRSPKETQTTENPTPPLKKKHQSMETIFDVAITFSSASTYSQYQTRKLKLEKLEESGVIEKRLWPLLLKHIITRDNIIPKYNVKTNEESYDSKYVILFAIFANRKALSGSISGGDSSLAFVTNQNVLDDLIEYDPKLKNALEKNFPKEEDRQKMESNVQHEAFETLIYDIVSYLLHGTSHSDSAANETNPKSIYLETECVRFLTHCYASIDNSSSISKTMLRLSNLSLWEAMNPRRRIMELEQCPPLKLLWRRRRQQQDQAQKVKDEKLAEKAHSIKKQKISRLGTARKRVPPYDEPKTTGLPGFESLESIFIPSLVSKFLNILNQLEEHNPPNYVHKSEYVDDDDDDYAECNTNNSNFIDDVNTNYKSHFPSGSAIFLNHVMVLFIDLLSIPSTRRYLQPYLLSTCFTVHCELSSFFNIETSIITPNNNQDNRNKNLTHPKIKLFHQLSQILMEIENFPMDNYTSKPLSNAQIQKQVHARCHALQQICFKYFVSSSSANGHNNSNNMEEEETVINTRNNSKLLDFVYAGVAYACQKHFLIQHLGRLDTADLQKLAHILRLVEHSSNDIDREHCIFSLENMNEHKKRSFLLAVLVYRHAIRPSEAITLSQLPLYPSEDVLWDANILPDGKSYGGNKNNLVLALPKLNTQFLTFGDYLLRSFKLMRLESAYGIRGDIVDAVRRSNPVIHHDYTKEHAEENDYYGLDDEDSEGIGKKDHPLTTTFNGWARMALEIKDFNLIKVAKPKLGETVPAKVLGEIEIDLEPLGKQIRQEWEEVAEFDNLFLVSIDASKMTGGQAPLLSKSSDRRVLDEEDTTFPLRYGVVAVRGCMVLEMRDSAGNLLNDPATMWEKKENEKEDQTKPKGTKRILKVALDSAQYAIDKNNGKSNSIYESFNLLVRRHGRENNFKAILETIRDLMYTSTQGMIIHKTVPPWLHNILLGYGDLTSATYSSPTMRAYAERTLGVTHPDAALDYGDTFLDERHLRESFTGYEVLIDGREQDTKQDKVLKYEERRNYRIKVVESEKRIEAVSYPFLKYKVKGNPIRFTPVQVGAVRSGLSPGLTLIVGPPGTGKTDVAVQIIANLYHSFPSQRTVIVTHSNAALNDLFEKVMARGDIDERYLLRLGSGERDLQTDSVHDFTKLGRVAHILSRRGELLEKVQLLSESLGVSGASERGGDGSPSYTCETAAFFNLHHIQKRIQIFFSNVRSCQEPNIGKFFPFKKYFEMNSDIHELELSLDEAKEKFITIENIFLELKEYRPLELLRSQRQRSDYLLTKQARIVAMTCTHAAIARSHLIDLGFQYDNILMEEAGQMLEVETFIPMLLQTSVTEEESMSLCRLKRICLIGDHNQLPPVVKNLAFSKYCHLDQSLFSRLVRLGVPSILLNKQGRARADIAKLYSWRYKGLGNLDHIFSSSFSTANAGLLHNFQMINVDDFEGRGESTPSPYFYQNLGEAEYVVALFQYMVLIGYPQEKISILSTYNGQKQLIEDIISQRCAPGTPLAGVKPATISTVDQYQGQQNEYILLSLVRTTSVGYLRDIRRLIVAVSRARLGLYVFARQSLFEECHELWGIMKHFCTKPNNKLQIITDEHYPCAREVGSDISTDKVYEVNDVVEMGGIVFSMQEQLCE